MLNLKDIYPSDPQTLNFFLNNKKYLIPMLIYKCIQLMLYECNDG